MATVDQRVNELIAHYGERFQRSGFRDMALLRAVLAYAIQLGKCDGSAECADAMREVFRDKADLPTILQKQAG